MIALLSIKPNFVEKIFSGLKKFEYRKTIFKKEVKRIVVYSTMPVGKIVGEFAIVDILEGSPKAIWESTKELSGINKTFFQEYFNGRTRGYAIKIGSKKVYKNPIDPKRMFDAFTPPQSFLYLDVALEKKLNLAKSREQAYTFDKLKASI